MSDHLDDRKHDSDLHKSLCSWYWLIRHADDKDYDDLVKHFKYVRRWCKKNGGTLP